MPQSRNEIQQEAARLLQILNAITFESCTPLSKEFLDLSDNPGIYAIKHRTQGILYIGKSGNVRSRLRGGHKALGWAFIDRMSPDDVKVAVAELSFPWTRLSLQLEGILLRQIRPPYNDRIAQED